MQIIKNTMALKKNNSDTCKMLEYSFNDKDIDLGISSITGRYPESGYCLNTISKELIYVLDGKGKLYFADEQVDFEKGDSILIDKNEKYYWDTSYCVVSIVSVPAWNKEQYKIVK